MRYLLLFAFIICFSCSTKTEDNELQNQVDLYQKRLSSSLKPSPFTRTCGQSLSNAVEDFVSLNDKFTELYHLRINRMAKGEKLEDTYEDRTMLWKMSSIVSDIEQHYQSEDYCLLSINRSGKTVQALFYSREYRSRLEKLKDSCSMNMIGAITLLRHDILENQDTTLSCQNLLAVIRSEGLYSCTELRADKPFSFEGIKRYCGVSH